MTMDTKIFAILTYLIDQMGKRNATKVGMTDHVMDARDLKIPDCTFDLEIDKSTLDALLCGDDPFINVAKMTKEIQRTLKVGGIYLIVSYGKPENRVLHLVNR